MMSIKLNEIIGLKPEEYKDWTFCLNNAPKEGVYSLESDHEGRLLEHISWHIKEGKRGLSAPSIRSTASSS